MKVIDEGSGGWKPWWLGQRMTCRECGRVVELERNDDALVNRMPEADKSRVTIACQRCGHMVRLDREYARERAAQDGATNALIN